jgi:hypothetical protein
VSERKVTEEFSPQYLSPEDAGFSGKTQSLVDWYFDGRDPVEGEEMEMVLPHRILRYRWTNGAFFPVQE